MVSQLIGIENVALKSNRKWARLADSQYRLAVSRADMANADMAIHSLKVILKGRRNQAAMRSDLNVFPYVTNGGDSAIYLASVLLGEYPSKER
jgi:hypothetical protein